MLAKRSVPDPPPDGRSPVGAPHPGTQAGCKLAFGRFHLSLLSTLVVEGEGSMLPLVTACHQTISAILLRDGHCGPPRPAPT